MQMSITLLITYAFVDFLAVVTNHLNFGVQRFGSYLAFRIEEYIV